MLSLLCCACPQLSAQTHIKTANDLKDAFSGKTAAITGTYILDNDIDMSGVAYSPSEFSGTLDGNGFVISNMTNSLFKTISATIQNLGLADSKITFSSSGTGSIYRGILAQYCSGTSTISNCFIQGTTTSSCYVTVDKASYEKGTIYVGSFLGYDGNKKVTITNSFVKNVTLTLNRNSTFNSYSSDVYAGGFVGTFMHSSSSISNSAIYNVKRSISSNFTSSKSHSNIWATKGESTVYNATGSNQTEAACNNIYNNVRTYFDYYTTTKSFYTDTIRRGTLLNKVSGESVNTLGRALVPATSTGATVVGNRYRVPEDYPTVSVINLKSGASFINNKDAYTPTVNVEKELGVSKWNMIGSFSAQSIDNLIFTSQQSNKNEITLYDFDVNAQQWNISYLEDEPNAVVGRGYLAYIHPETWEESGAEAVTSGNITLSFPAVSVPGNFTLSESFTSENESNFTALSNPWTSGLNGGTFISDNITQGNAIYVLRDDAVAGSSFWEAYTTEGSTTASQVEISPLSGFMVGIPTGSSSYNFSFSTPASYGENVSIFKSENAASTVEFVLTDGNITRNLLAVRNQGASDGFDISDAYAMPCSALDFYFNLDGKQIWKNVFKSEDYFCPLSFVADKDKEVEIYLKKANGDMNVYLVNVENGSETILNGNSISLSLNAGENTSDFALKFSKKNVGLDNMANNVNNISVYNIADRIMINGQQLQRAEVYNTLGQIVYASKLSGESAALDSKLQSGAYLIKVYAGNMSKTQKIVIK